jgi:hypothetical protein
MQLKNMNTLHIQIACGGIEPQFFERRIPFTTIQAAWKKNPNTQNLKAQENIQSLV